MAQSVPGAWSQQRYAGSGVTVVDHSRFPSITQSRSSVTDSASGPGQGCKLIQISDLHLQAQPHQRYRGFDVDKHLLAVLDHIDRHHVDFDGLLLSGDLVHHGHAAGYRRLVDYLERFDKPWYWIPGNHDSPVEMRRIRPTPSDSFVCNGCRVVLLDSTSAADGRGGGSLSDPELQRLRDQLGRARTAGESVVLVLHHNPLPVQSAWQDAIMLGNATCFWQLLESYQLSVAVLFGHLHQHWDQTCQGVRVLSCPSTAIQFARQQPQIKLETDGQAALPGYRWLNIGAPYPSTGAPSDTEVSRFSTAADQLNGSWTWLETGIERVRLA